MTSEGSSASTSGSSSPSTTDLKGLIKDSLSELLHDEPALLRGAMGSVKGESHGGVSSQLGSMQGRTCNFLCFFGFWVISALFGAGACWLVAVILGRRASSALLG